MEHNPYAPPSASSEAPPDGLVFSVEGIEVVTSMAKWMRALSTFYYVSLALMVLGGGCAMLGVGSAAGGAVMIGLLIGFAIAGLFIGAAATWLRDAADYFERGVGGDDEFSLGMGFRKLRAYWIMFGILSILEALSTINDALEVL